VERDFALREKNPGSAPWLSRIHCFNFGATVSLGKVSGDIPGISEGARWLAEAIAASLYAEDIETHWQALQAYDKPELLGDEWRMSDWPEPASAEGELK
jgi:FAD-dependent urate hydroxylase